MKANTILQLGFELHAFFVMGDDALSVGEIGAISPICSRATSGSHDFFLSSLQLSLPFGQQISMRTSLIVAMLVL